VSEVTRGQVTRRFGEDGRMGRAVSRSSAERNPALPSGREVNERRPVLDKAHW
jgi:hypothetical protein